MHLRYRGEWAVPLIWVEALSDSPSMKTYMTRFDLSSLKNLDLIADLEGVNEPRPQGQVPDIYGRPGTLKCDNCRELKQKVSTGKY